MWEGVGDRTELRHIDLHSYGHQCFFPVLLAAQPEAWGPSLLPDAVFLYRIFSPNWLNFRSTQLYYSSPPTQSPPITSHRNMHFRRLWNGMFDRHWAEITVMQFTCHSLLVHQFVTVPWDFNPVPYCQPSSPTPMEYALLPSLEWHIWQGRRSIYNNRIIIIREQYLKPFNCVQKNEFWLV